ncbi:MAG: flagellar hook-associated protein FlgL, partial [Halopseudomonas sp.]
ALQAGNGALGQADRQALAQELGEREEELLGLFNSRNARSEYLFGGFQSQTPPFVKAPDGSYSYEGDEGQRSIQIAGSKQVAINDNGKKLFVDVPNVNRVTTDTSSVTARISLGVVEDKGAFDNDFYPAEAVSIRIGPGGESYEIHDSADTEVPPAILATGVIEPNDGESYQIRFGGVVVTLDGELKPGDQFQITSAPTEEKRSILETVAELRTTLETTDDSRKGKLERRDQLSIAIQNLDNGMNQVLSVQTSIGARMNVIESTQNENAELKLINQGMTAQLSELDYAEALSRLSFETVVLQAAQQSFVKISGLSLFNLL